MYAVSYEALPGPDIEESSPVAVGSAVVGGSVVGCKVGTTLVVEGGRGLPAPEERREVPDGGFGDLGIELRSGGILEDCARADPRNESIKKVEEGD